MLFYAEMLEIAGYFTAIYYCCQNGHVAFAVLTFSHIDPKAFNLHLLQLEFLRGMSSSQVLLRDLPFFPSGFRTTFLR
jgi:hypothetical protein